MNKFFAISTVFLIASTALGQTPTTSPVASLSTQGESVTVKLFFKYFGLPNEMKVFQLKPEDKKKLWDTEVVKTEGELPVGSEIKGDTLVLKTGQNKKFVLVFKNTTDKTLAFFAAPHEMKPESNALGYKFKCLCINRTYEVEPGSYWYRVVELRISPQVSGDYLEITHSLFRVTAKSNSLQYQPMKNMDMDQGM